MTAAESPSVLQRMTTVAAPVIAEVPLTASRAVKLALTRSAEATIGLVLTVDTVAEETQEFDPFLASLSDDMVLLWLDQNGTHAGVIALDQEMSAAIVEMRTTGSLRDKPAPDRRATAADISLAHPFFAGLIDALNLTTEMTALEGWMAQVRVGARIASVRAASLALPENTFRHMMIQVDLGAGGRKGKIRLALPSDDAPPVPVATLTDSPDWAVEMEDTVMEAPVILDAILHRSKFPLSMLAGLHVGQVIPLPGCSVSSVRVEAGDGTFVGRGRIGQMGGNIAVRLEIPQASPMTELHADRAGSHLPDAVALSSEPAINPSAVDTLPRRDALPDMPFGDVAGDAAFPAVKS